MHSVHLPDGSQHPGLPADAQDFVGLLGRLAVGGARLTAEEAAAAELFDWSAPLVASRAPGRLDVMGGIADYSGSLVLQMPIAEACFVAAQRQPSSPSMRVVSFGGGAADRQLRFEMPLRELCPPSGPPTPLAAVREILSRDASSAWAGYVVGCLSVLYHEGLASPADGGVAVAVRSNVPEGKGVSSSAALEVSTMVALLGALGKPPIHPAARLAALCQRVENCVVGAPCGIMDQMASALGQNKTLLALECRPAIVRGWVPVPSGIRLWGIDSGVRHSVGGSNYGTVRAATFIGRELLRARAAEAAGASPTDTSAAQPDARPYLEHLTELTPAELAAAGPLPHRLSGADFLALMPGGHRDDATEVGKETEYAVAACTAHPVEENARVAEFQAVLHAMDALGGEGGNDGAVESMLSRLGALMYASHLSYSRIGLGSDATDKLVELVRHCTPPLAGTVTHLWPP